MAMLNNQMVYIQNLVMLVNRNAMVTIPHSSPFLWVGFQQRKKWRVDGIAIPTSIVINVHGYMKMDCTWRLDGRYQA